MAASINGFLHKIGIKTIYGINALGSIFLFFLDGLRHIFITPKLLRKVVRQLYVIGHQSLFVILLIGVFTGMVLGLQGYYLLIKFGSVGMLGTAVALTLVRELGPVLTAIMVAGRAGSSMAAEIGVMRITDQIDALEVMDIPAMGYLVTPRFLAALIAFPLLTAIFDVIGIIGGFLTGVVLLGMNSGLYFDRVESSILMRDVMEGFTKAAVFAILVTLVSCYQGYFVHKRRDSMGPEAVGNATTSAVVISSVSILIADYIITSAML
jgi:phospholipid/cholesterol/gamma-HCH transport system permease protein